MGPGPAFEYRHWSKIELHHDSILRYRWQLRMISAETGPTVCVPVLIGFWKCKCANQVVQSLCLSFKKETVPQCFRPWLSGQRLLACNNYLLYWHFSISFWRTIQFLASWRSQFVLPLYPIKLNLQYSATSIILDCSTALCVSLSVMLTRTRIYQNDAVRHYKNKLRSHQNFSIGYHSIWNA